MWVNGRVKCILNGSYLRFKRQKSFRGIKSYKFRDYSKYPLKMQNKVILILHALFDFSTIPFCYVSAPLDNEKIKILIKQSLTKIVTRN